MCATVQVYMVSGVARNFRQWVRQFSCWSSCYLVPAIQYITKCTSKQEIKHGDARIVIIVCRIRLHDTYSNVGLLAV